MSNEVNAAGFRLLTHSTSFRTREKRQFSIERINWVIMMEAKRMLECKCAVITMVIIDGLAL